MKQFDYSYMKDPMFLMGISYGLMKAAMTVEERLDDEGEEAVKDAIYRSVEYYKEEARRVAAGDREDESTGGE